jgi:predicted pyridoxine 5'-phosphate oxidase superfamily flavin-nucleotide-binding protein
MPTNFDRISRTNSVRTAQQHYYEVSEPLVDAAMPLDELTAEETDFIRARNSFYMATITENGWPYIQHRGGPPGFMRVLDPHTLAFADYRGNRQMLSTGNLATNDRVALFLMDYPQRTRLKILGHTTVKDAREHPELVEQLADPKDRRLIERLFIINVVGFDWNCPAHITPRYTPAEIEKYIAPLKRRIVELEAALLQSQRSSDSR